MKSYVNAYNDYNTCHSMTDLDSAPEYQHDSKYVVFN